MAVLHLLINCFLSVVGGFLTRKLMIEFTETFIKADLFGKDLCKPVEKRGKIPEPMGAISATVYLMLMFCFIPFPFSGALLDDDPSFPHSKFVEFIAGLLSICCMVFLGFADDVLDLRWRHKLLLPSLASLPLLLVYAANFNSTTVLLPRLLSAFGTSVNLGIVYYVYMGMLAVFCTNAINILAGINGLEAGQSLVIGASILLFNGVQILRNDSHLYYHYLSCFFLMPYMSTTLVLYAFNRYPARVFVGDTFCYFSGMLFAVVGILGHFSKTLMLFFIPQTVNFVLSCPQLFRLIPCPRHRLPRYDPSTDLLYPSTTQFIPSKLPLLGRICFQILKTFKFIKVTPLDSGVMPPSRDTRMSGDATSRDNGKTSRDIRVTSRDPLKMTSSKDDAQADAEGMVECSNLTIINTALVWLGPMHEQRLCWTLLAVQILSSLLGLIIRFPLASFFYDRVE